MGRKDVGPGPGDKPKSGFSKGIAAHRRASKLDFSPTVIRDAKYKVNRHKYIERLMLYVAPNTQELVNDLSTTTRLENNAEANSAKRPREYTKSEFLHMR